MKNWGPFQLRRFEIISAGRDSRRRLSSRPKRDLAACVWIARAGAKLGQGFVVTIDYGHEARELYDERHMRGTLLAYEGHRASEEFFRAPGEQDLTAHVNFTALDLWDAPADSFERDSLRRQISYCHSRGTLILRTFDWRARPKSSRRARGSSSRR